MRCWYRSGRVVLLGAAVYAAAFISHVVFGVGA